MKERGVRDVSALRTYSFGPSSPVSWGTLAFIALEATGFALGIGSYLYLAWLGQNWPPIGSPPPGLAPGILFTIILIASAVPNIWLDRRAHKEDLKAVRIGLVLISVIGLILLAIRIFEFMALNVRWDTNAYGSIVWLLLGLHTAHLITDVGDTLVLTALMFTRHGQGKRFSDVADNCFYWNFVILSWLPIYLLLYWVPRM